MKHKNLVTGGAGFIGSHLCQRLLQEGHTVFCLDNFDSYYSRDIKETNISQLIRNPNFHLIEGDILDEELLTPLFGSNHFVSVFHLAAKAGVRPSINYPIEYHEINVLGTIRLLEKVKSFNVKNFIFASSSSVYGERTNAPFKESDFVTHPISPYAASKVSGELLCSTYSHLYDIKTIALRFFTVYGPRQRPDLAIHRFVDAILNDRSIEIYGDGKQQRDFTYIEDIIDGIMLSCNYKCKFEIFNLGESQTISVVDLVGKIESLLGRKAKLKFMDAIPGDVMLTFADVSKAKELLGYSPKWTLDTGLTEFVKWKVQ